MTRIMKVILTPQTQRAMTKEELKSQFVKAIGTYENDLVSGIADKCVQITNQQTSSLQKALEERDKEIEKLNESLLDYKGEAENFKEKMLGYKDERDLILKKYSAEVVKKEKFIFVVADLGEKIKAKSSLIESIAGALDKWQNASLVPYDREKIIQIRKHGTEALTLYNNYKNKENDTRKS